MVLNAGARSRKIDTISCLALILANAQLGLHAQTVGSHVPFCCFHLLCAASTAPADCDRRTAVDVALGPEASNEIACGLGAREMMAQTAIRPKEGEYSKIACARRKVVAGQ